MGKAQRNRANKKAPRTDPIAKPVKPPADPELAALRESRILPVLRDLQNPDAKARTTAAGAIANIVQDQKCRKLLLREQVVHIVLSETLTDASIDSRAAGWEILRVLAQEEESDFCVHLHRLDILTAIEHAAKAILETLTSSEPPFAKLLKAQQVLVWEMTNSLLSLLGFLAVARDEILDAIVASPIILRFLFRLASSDSVPQEIFEETLSCLMTLSEDNLKLGHAITDDQETRCYDELLKLASGIGPRAVLSCGVLHNIFASLQWLDHSPGKDGACDALLIPSLTRALEQSSPSSKSPTMQVAMEILASIGTDLVNAFEKGNKSKVTADKASAAEEWGGIEDDDAMDVDEGAGAEDDDAEEGDEEEDDDDEDDDELDDDLGADLERVTARDDTPEEADLDDLPTLKELLQKAVPQLIRLTNVATDTEEGLAIQGHALSALNNIAWTLSCIEFADGENSNIFKAWVPTAKKIWSKAITPILESDSADLEMATVVTSLAWAVSRSVNGEALARGNQHRRFFALYQASKKHAQTDVPLAQGDEAQDPLQGLGVKCIGVLGSLARDPAPISVNREIGIFLMTVLNTPDTPAADAIEAFNQLFDIYADEDAPCDKEVFWKDDFLKHLEELVPRLKTIAKGIDKRVFEELRIKADETVLNLRRFIQYKKKHVPQP
ncbi:hypothetical protein B0T22DRAFT_459650 [Podospora appendiculata]|uniref:SYO1-like TPR repeats domain-containing protein n=1 Tax=Podospora appendiculata TaxID=314037 RepID=A0AAE0X9F8_9PEZI|nr:hypothetical protein B0T22DRAFT_459650 [Podospora appendiculata]